MEAFETFEHAGFTVELHQDEEPGSPAEWDTLGTLYAFSMGLNEGAPGERAPGDVQEAANRDRPGMIVRYLRSQGVVAVLCRFQDYGSSGATISALEDDQDERATGYIACTLERGRAEGPVDGDVRRVLVSELGEWSAWVNGEVVGYVVRDPETHAVLDSCWGFYPDGTADPLAYVREEARSEAEGIAEDREAKRARTIAGWAVARVASC